MIYLGANPGIGNTGPQGIQGIQGPVGNTGPQGLTGNTGPIAPSWALIPVGFRANKNGVDQTGLTAGPFNKITFTTEEYDNGSFYDAPNSRWIPPAGLVHIDATLYYGSGLTAGSGINIWIYKNGVALKHALLVNSSTLNGVQISVDDIASGTDYYEVYELHGSSTAVVSGVITDTFFSGHVTGGPVGPMGPAAPIGAIQPTGFRATKGGVAQTAVVTGLTTYTKLTFGTEDYDYGGYYDVANSRWIPPAGVVHIDAGLYVTVGMVASTRFNAFVYKNGLQIKCGEQQSPGSSFATTRVSVDDLANGFDYYEIYTSHNAGVNIQIDGDVIRTFFNGHVAGGPVGPTGPAAPVGAIQPTGFRASKSVDQTGIANAYTKLIFPNEEYDYGSYYDAPNSRWLPPAGLVHIDGALICASGITASQWMYLAVYKNGVILKQTQVTAGAITTDGVSVSVDDLSTGTDYYELYCWLQGTSSTVTASTSTRFSGHVTGGPVGPTGPAAPVGAMQPTGFRAHKNAVNQTGIANNTATKLTFGFEDYDQGGFYDTVNSRWTPPAGIVHIDAAIYATNLTQNVLNYLYVYKNGVVLKLGVQHSASSTVEAVRVSVDDVSNGTDYYEIYTYLGSPSTSTVDGGMSYFTAHVTGGPKGDVGLTGAPGSALAAPTSPQGRLTLQAGVPVMTTTTTGISTVRYTPSSAGDRIPIWDGTNWTMTGFTELSNVITDTTKNPAAVLSEAMYDMFVWNDSGTMRLSRGPPWLNTATVTITIASPAVITWNGHGLHEGSPVIFTTTGGLPTGIVAGTIYYVGRSPTANTFSIATTIANSSPGNVAPVAGTLVATSGTQSGVHTGINRDSIRGVGAGTTELVAVGGFKLNANIITNGPAAQRGTWVGCIRTNAAGTVDWRFGSLATGGAQAAFLYVWNAYNRVDVFTTVIDSVQNWASSQGGTFEHSFGMRVNFISGWLEDAFDAEYSCSMGASAGSYASSGIGYDQSNGYSGVPGAYFGANYLTCGTTKFGATAIGAHFVTPAEGVISGTNTVYGYYTANPTNIMGSAFYFRMRM